MELHFKFAALVICAIVLVAGCKSNEQAAPPANPAFNVKPAGSQTNLVIAPANSPVGHIRSVKRQLKFVVIDFPVGQVPADGTRLAVFRGGAKVGEVKISGSAKGTFIIGDILAGDAQDGDQVWAE